MFSWAYEFANFDEPLALLNSMGMIAGRKDLSAEAREHVKVELREALTSYEQPSGGYRIPHACRLFWGRR
jgi:hypothetical protein